MSDFGKDDLKTIEKALAFYPSQAQQLESSATSNLKSEQGGDTAFKSDPSKGCNGIMQLGEKITGDLADQANQINTYLLDYSGLCSSKMRSYNDSDILFNPDKWLECYRHLPLVNYGELQKTEMNRKVKGVEIASSFLATILGFAVAGGPALVAFGNYLTSLGDQIRLGSDKGSSKYNVSVIATGVTMGQDGRLLANIKGFFLDFEQSKTVISSNCASASWYDMKFSYRRIDGIMNYSFLDRPDVKKQVDAMINGSQVDDVKKANNFFGGDFSKQDDQQKIS